MGKFIAGRAVSRGLLICVLSLHLGATALKAQQGAAAAEQRLDGLLAAMGGRAVWASLTGVRVTATHYTSAVRLPFRNDIWNDFVTPRHRIEASNEEISRALVWQKSGGGWLRRENEKPRPLTAQEEAEEARWWESNPYRTLHRLAARDPELSVRLIEPDRLEVFRKDGARLCWFRLNRMNEPVAFGTWGSEEGTIFGPLTEANFGLRRPKWTARPDGRWRAELLEFMFLRERMNIDTTRPKS